MRKRIGSIISVAAVMSVALIGCGATAGVTSTDKPAPHVSGNPQAKLVYIGAFQFGSSYQMDIAKVCDGTTLLYLTGGMRLGGISAIPDSPECRE